MDRVLEFTRGNGETREHWHSEFLAGLGENGEVDDSQRTQYPLIKEYTLNHNYNIKAPL